VNQLYTYVAKDGKGKQKIQYKPQPYDEALDEAKQWADENLEGGIICLRDQCFVGTSVYKKIDGEWKKS